MEHIAYTAAALEVATTQARRIANTLRQLTLRARAGHPPSAAATADQARATAELAKRVSQIWTTASHGETEHLRDATARQPLP